MPTMMIILLVTVVVNMLGGASESASLSLLHSSCQVDTLAVQLDVVLKLAKCHWQCASACQCQSLAR